MIRSRTGWKTVWLILLFLVARAVVGLVLEIRVLGGEVSPLRIVAMVVWVVILVGIGCGLELARFAAVILLTLGTAVGVAVLMDPQFSIWPEGIPDLELLRGFLIFGLATNLAIVPLLAFSKAVREYFSKIPRYGRQRS